jgi:hypothetical protein
MPNTLIVSTPTPQHDSFVVRLLAASAPRRPAPPVAPASTVAAGAGPHCPLVSILLLPHPRRAHLQIAHFPGGWVVVPRGQFKDFELAVFVPEGARLPEYLLKRANLWDYSSGYGTLRGPEGNRVAWTKVGGVLSYGLLLKVFNDPSPKGEPNALLFGPPVLFAPAGDWATLKLFTEHQCAARFLGIE